MKFLNIILAKKLGGMERASIDYANALMAYGHEVINVVSKTSMIDNDLSGPKEYLTNFGKWDLFSVLKLKKLISHHKPDFIIAHGMRPIKFLRKIKTSIPIIGVAHNYYDETIIASYKYAIALTNDAKRHMVEQGMEAKKIEVIPNMTLIPDELPRNKKKPGKPIVIGTMGVFEVRKGIEDFIEALRILEGKGFYFNAVIAGGGTAEWERRIKNCIESAALTNKVKLLGWVKDRAEFYKEIDIFCLPSRYEAFGLALIEAMAYSLPIVSTNADGPSELLEDGQDSIICEINNPIDLADKLKLVINNPDLREMLASNARKKVENLYSPLRVSELINNAVMKFHECEMKNFKVVE